MKILNTYLKSYIYILIFQGLKILMKSTTGNITKKLSILLLFICLVQWVFYNKLFLRKINEIISEPILLEESFTYDDNTFRTVINWSNQVQQCKYESTCVKDLNKGQSILECQWYIINRNCNIEGQLKYYMDHYNINYKVLADKLLPGDSINPYKCIAIKHRGHKWTCKKQVEMFKDMNSSNCVVKADSDLDMSKFREFYIQDNDMIASFESQYTAFNKKVMTPFGLFIGMGKSLCSHIKSFNIKECIIPYIPEDVAYGLYMNENHNCIDISGQGVLLETVQKNKFDFLKKNLNKRLLQPDHIAFLQNTCNVSFTN